MNRRQRRVARLLRPRRQRYRYVWPELAKAAWQLPPPAPYSELEAAVDALAGRRPCPHGLWPHQGTCEPCVDNGIMRLARPILLPPRQAVAARAAGIPVGQVVRLEHPLVR